MATLSQKIDLLNVFLVAISLVIAIQIPFKLFLFSYAILGPIHYLTEILWLKEKNYFMKASKKWFYIFLGTAALMALAKIGDFVDISSIGSINDLASFLRRNVRVFTLGTFLFALSFLFSLSWIKRVFAFGCSYLFAIAISYFIPSWLLFLGVFILTIIHVYLFTLLFVLYGSIRSKSKLGYATVVALLIVPIAIFFLQVYPADYQLDPSTSQSFLSSNFSNINVYIAQLFGQVENNNFDLISVFGIKVQIFIAFAYTYHYLNWFSKTNVIGWKDALTPKRLLFVGSIWIAAVGLYLYDYKTGFSALFFLSYLHVLLEFPLNWITFKALIPKMSS